MNPTDNFFAAHAPHHLKGKLAFGTLLVAHEDVSWESVQEVIPIPRAAKTVKIQSVYDTEVVIVKGDRELAVPIERVLVVL